MNTENLKLEELSKQDLVLIEGGNEATYQMGYKVGQWANRFLTIAGIYALATL